MMIRHDPPDDASDGIRPLLHRPLTIIFATLEVLSRAIEHERASGAFA